MFIAINTGKTDRKRSAIVNLCRHAAILNAVGNDHSSCQNYFFRIAEFGEDISNYSASKKNPPTEIF